MRQLLECASPLALWNGTRPPFILKNPQSAIANPKLNSCPLCALIFGMAGGGKQINHGWTRIRKPVRADIVVETRNEKSQAPLGATSSLASVYDRRWWRRESGGHGPPLQPNMPLLTELDLFWGLDSTKMPRLRRTGTQFGGGASRLCEKSAGENSLIARI